MHRLEVVQELLHLHLLVVEVRLLPEAEELLLEGVEVTILVFQQAEAVEAPEP